METLCYIGSDSDLCDEHWLHVKYHIIDMTAVAYTQDLQVTERSTCVCWTVVKLYAGCFVLLHACV